MKRKITLVVLATVTSLLLVIWGASHFIFFHGGASLLSTPWQLLGEASYGRLEISIRHQWLIHNPVDDTFDFHHWWGFGYEHSTGVYLSDDVNGTYCYEENRLIIPFWFLVLVFGAYPIKSLIPWYRRWREPKEGHCHNCGYNLTGNVSGRCPECGTRIGVIRRKKGWWSRRRRRPH